VKLKVNHVVLPVQVKNRATVAAEALDQAQALREALAASIMPDADAEQQQHLQQVEREISRCTVASPAVVGPCTGSMATQARPCVYTTMLDRLQCCTAGLRCWVYIHRLQSEITAEHQKLENWRQENIRRRCVTGCSYTQYRHSEVTTYQS
jgi:hypothetical protein